MFVEWNSSLEIGDPVVDSEHRYLVELINNLHHQYENGSVTTSLARLFTHLADYVHRHFKNEEALMSAIAYPDLPAHQKEHRQLLDQSMELSEQFIDGSETITEETVTFLKNWVLDHVVGTDMKIRAFLKENRPPNLTRIPAFASSNGPDFKRCTLCGKVWPTFEALQTDPSITLLGCQPDATNHLYNLIMFNCSCDTTLAMFIKEFVHATDIPFALDDNSERTTHPAHCLNNDRAGPCLKICACAYTQQILCALSNSRSLKKVAPG